MQRTFAIWLTVALAPIYLALSSTQTTSLHVGSGSNTWQRTVFSATAPPQDPEQRAKWDKRGAYFDALVGAPAPLDQPNTAAHGWGLSLDDVAPGRPELLPSSDAVVVGDFVDYHAYLSTTHRSIYTEISVKVERVLKDTPKPILVGANIYVLEPGGAVRLANGITVREDLERAFSIQPGERYLMFLSYNADGDFYTLTKAWLLVDGTAAPVAPDDVERARRGRSAYAGMPEGQFLNSVQDAVNKAATSKPWP